MLIDDVTQDRGHAKPSGGGKGGSGDLTFLQSYC